jgi:hypothetical protein
MSSRKFRRKGYGPRQGIVSCDMFPARMRRIQRAASCTIVQVLRSFHFASQRFIVKGVGVCYLRTRSGAPSTIQPIGSVREILDSYVVRYFLQASLKIRHCQAFVTF